MQRHLVNKKNDLNFKGELYKNKNTCGFTLKYYKSNGYFQTVK